MTITLLLRFGLFLHDPTLVAIRDSPHLARLLTNGRPVLRCRHHLSTLLASSQDFRGVLYAIQCRSSNRSVRGHRQGLSRTIQRLHLTSLMAKPNPRTLLDDILSLFGRTPRDQHHTLEDIQAMYSVANVFSKSYLQSKHLVRSGDLW